MSFLNCAQSLEVIASFTNVTSFLLLPSIHDHMYDESLGFVLFRPILILSVEVLELSFPRMLTWHALIFLSPYLERTLQTGSVSATEFCLILI